MDRLASTERLPANAAGLARASALLSAGRLVALPTETVYGLGADARDPRAVAAIFEAKGRPRFNPLIVHLAAPAEAAVHGALSPAAEALAEAFWPGPLTLVVPRREGGPVCDLATAGLDTVALRVPAARVARGVLRAFGGPVAAPSANPSGRISPTAAEHVLDGLDGRIAAVLDGGPCAVGLESTIVGFAPDGPRLLRPGGLAVEEIEAVLGRSLLRSEASEETVAAPGMLSSHYAPGAGLRLEAEAPRPGEAFLGFGPLPETAGPALTLSERADPTEAAANLFAHLRALDARLGGQGTIAVAPVPHTGLGLAIADRLRRAAAPRP